MKGPILQGLEFRSYASETIKYVDKKTGKRESFFKQIIRTESSDGTPVLLNVRSPDDAVIEIKLKKGEVFDVELTGYMIVRGTVEASCDAQPFVKQV